MMAVRWKRGCSRIIAASSKPSRSGMQTSIRISATSFFSRHSNASRAEEALKQLLADLGEHDLVAQQLRLLIVDQQDVHLVRAAFAGWVLTDAATCAAPRATARR